MAFNTQHQGAPPWTSFCPSHQARLAPHHYGSTWMPSHNEPRAGPGVGFHYQRPCHRDHVACSNAHAPSETCFVPESFPRCTFPEADVHRRYDAVEREFITPLERMRNDGCDDEREHERECGYAETVVEEDGSDVEGSANDVLAEASDSSHPCEVEKSPLPHASEHLIPLPHVTNAALDKRWAALSEREANLIKREGALGKAVEQLELDRNEVMRQEQEICRLLEEIAMDRGRFRGEKSRRQRLPLFTPAQQVDEREEHVDWRDAWHRLGGGPMRPEWKDGVDGMSERWAPYARKNRWVPFPKRWRQVAKTSR
jgi:hypothetical protein